MFDELKNLFEKKEPIVDSNNGFMLNRYLSMYVSTFTDSVCVNNYLGKIPNKLFNILLYSIVGKENQAPFIKYIKKKDSKKKVDKILLEKVCKGFCCNERHGEEIIEVLKAEGKNPKHIFGLK